MRVRRVNAQRLLCPRWWRRSELALSSKVVARACEYQIVLGFATDWLPPQTKALALAVAGVGR